MELERMEVEEAVVDLSIGSRRAPEVNPQAPAPHPPRTTTNWPARRSLRPRTEQRCYTESPDLLLEEPKTNGVPNGNCDTDDEDIPMEMPPSPFFKDRSAEEIKERKQLIRRLRDELRNEEMTLVLLKKLKQSHQMKENVAMVAVVAPCSSNSSLPPTPGALNAHSKQIPPRASSKPPPPQPNVHHLLRGHQPGIARGAPNAHVPSPMMPPRGLAPGMPPSMHQSSSANSRVGSSSASRSMSLGGYQMERKDPRHSPVPSISQIPSQDRGRGGDSDAQTPAQRQAAAKHALRKQLEKTLLQIPPPKPPPPEMHFIPNPSNTEFIYLVGLEHVVDYITKDSRSPPPPEPFRCSQCSTNFTPVWKWEKGSSKAGKEPRVICEQCVTNNVKKALKAEHTNRLKTAFVKALQQEQEIEQRLAQGSPQPEQPPPVTTPQPLAKPATPKPPPPPPLPSPNREHLAKLADSAKYNPHHAATAALHQQLLRGIPQQPLPAHMLPFSPILYPYQLAMAQAGKGPVAAAAAAANLAEIHRQATAEIHRQATADYQRQYLLDMVPSPNTSRHSMNNWKT